MPTDPTSTPESFASSTGEPDEHHDFFRTGDAGSYPEGPANAAVKSDHWPEAELPSFVRTPAMDARRARNKKIVWWSVAVLLPLNALAVLSGLSRDAQNTSGAEARKQPTPAASPLSSAPIVALPAARPKDTAPKATPAPPQAEPNPAEVMKPQVSPKALKAASSMKAATVIKQAPVLRPRAALPASAPNPAPTPVAPNGSRPTAAFPIL